MQHVVEASSGHNKYKKVSKLTKDGRINAMILNVYSIYCAGKGGAR